MNRFSNLKKQYEDLLSDYEDLENKKQDVEKELKQLILDKEKTKKEYEELVQEKNRVHEMLVYKEDLFVNNYLMHMDNLQQSEFIKYIRATLEKLGYKMEFNDSDNKDEIIAKKDGKKYVIMCEKTFQLVKYDRIEKIYAAKGIHNADEAVLLTTGSFSTDIIEKAEKLGIELWNRDKLISKLYQMYDFDINNIQHRNNTNELYDNTVNEYDDVDPLLEEAIELVIDTEQGSASWLQRKLNIGYNRAGRIMDQMEERGIVSETKGSKPRDVLISKERWAELKKNNTNENN